MGAPRSIKIYPSTAEGPNTIGGMKKLMFVALLVALGVIAARRLRTA